MKTIDISNISYEIENEAETCICLNNTTASSIGTVATVDIIVGQILYNAKHLKAGSIIFTLKPNSIDYYVNMFPNKFGIPTTTELKELILMRSVIEQANARVLELISKIPKLQ